ncbi:MAG: amidohydrolase [Pseudomonadales bacterium]|nr:amidohydrolase [Pseudomonadales bacterium]
MTQLIDVHTHIVPNSFPDSPDKEGEPKWPCMVCEGDSAKILIEDKPYRQLDSRSWDVNRRIEDMDRTKVARQALSPMPELLSYWFKPSAGMEMCLWMNKVIAEMVALHPGRFSGLGIVPMQDPAMAAKMLTRIKADGFSGVEIGSNINEVMLGDSRFDEFFAEAEAQDLAIFVHALRPIGVERLNKFPDLVPFAAFPLDTALTAVSLIRAGIPHKYPRLRIGFSHGGGAIVPLVHRLTQGWKLTKSFGGSLPETPQSYAARFFYDSLVYDPGYLSYLMTDFAPGQYFAGTDYPYAIMERDPAAFIGQTSIADKDSLLFQAAERFLGIA